MRSEKWSTHSEKMNVLKPDAAGPVLLYENGKVYTYDGEGHVMYLGMSGTGKSRRGTYPLTMSIIRNQESGLVLDPKGEIWANTKDMIPDSYTVHCIDFRNLFSDVESWNPLRAPYELWLTGTPKDRNTAAQMVEELSFILYPESEHTDPYWAQQARQLFLGATYSLFALAKPEQVNLANVYYMVLKGDSRYGSSSYLHEFVKIIEEEDIKGKEDILLSLQSYTSNNAEETKSGIRSVFMNGIGLATKSESIRRFLSNDDLKVNKLQGDKLTLTYVIVPDWTPIYNDMSAVLVSQILNHYIRIAENEYNGTLPVRLNVILEELGNLSALSNLPHLMTAGRSRGIRVEFCLQSLTQLDTIYGKAKAQTILSNVDCLIAYRTINRETLEELSFKCGNKEVIRDDHPYMEPLCTPCQLSQLENGQALVLIQGRYKFITKLPDFTEMSISQYRPEKTATVKKGKKSKVSYFDVIGFVKRVKAIGMDSRDSRLDAILPKEFKDLPRLSIDDLIKGLEEDSRELDIKIAEAVEQNKQKPQPKKVHRVLVNCIFIDTTSADDIIKAISDLTKEDYGTVRAKVEGNKVFEYEFKSLKEARALINAIKKAGADAWLE